MKKNTRVIAGTGLLTAIVVVLQMLGVSIKFGMFSITLTLAPIIIGAAIYGIGAGAWLGAAFGAAVLISGDAAPFLALNPPVSAFETVGVVLLKGILAGLCASLAFKAVEKAGAKNAKRTALFASPLVGSAVFIIGYGLVVTLLINQKLADKLGAYTSLVASVAAALLAFISCIVAVAIYDTVKKNTNLGAVVIAGIVAPVVNTGVFIIGCKLFFMDIINAWAEAAGVASAGLFIITGVVGFNFIIELAVNLLLASVIVRIISIARKENKR